MRNRSKFYLTTFLLWIFLVSCVDKSQFTLEKCKELSYQFFKGLPKPSHQYKNYCQDYNLDFLQINCKKALNELILGKSHTYLIKKYDKNIMMCFTQNDLKKFSN